MKRYIVYPLLAGFFLAQSTAYAEIIQGRIVSIDSSNDMLRVMRLGAPGDHLNVKVKDDTRARNIASLQELKVGQEVKIDASENKVMGQWEAKSVELMGSQPS